MSDNARTSAKRSRSPSPSDAARSLRTAKKSSSTAKTMPDAQLRSSLEELTNEQLRSLIMQVSRSNASAKKSVTSLLPSRPPSTSLYWMEKFPSRMWLADPWDGKDTTELEDVAHGVEGIIKDNIDSIVRECGTVDYWRHGVDALMNLAHYVIHCKNEVLRELLLKTEVTHHMEQEIFNLAGKMESVRSGVKYMSVLSSALDAAYKRHGREDFEFLHKTYKNWAHQNSGVDTGDDSSSDSGADSIYYWNQISGDEAI